MKRAFGCLIQLVLVTVVIGGLWLARPMMGDSLEHLRLTREGILLRQNGQTKEALLLYSKAVERFPDDGGFALGYARLLQQTGRHGKAERFYIQGFRLKPSAPVDDRLSYARMLMSQQRYQEARGQYHTILQQEAHPGRAVYLELGMFYREMAQRAQRLGFGPTEGWLLRWASYYYQCAAALNTSDYEAWFGLGAVAQQRGQSRQAVRYFCRALEAQPGRAAALFSLGHSVVSRGDWAAGLALMQQGIDQRREDGSPTAADQADEWTRVVQGLRATRHYRTGSVEALRPPAKEAPPEEKTEGDSASPAGPSASPAVCHINPA